MSFNLFRKMSRLRFERARLQAAPHNSPLPDFVTPTGAIVIPTGPSHSRREWDSQRGACPEQAQRAEGDPLFLATACAAIALFALVSPASAQAQKPPTASPNADLPAGPMQAKATTACLECHEARIILQQRLTKPVWTKEVEKMTKWGAVVDSADRDALIDYLSSNFSPEKPAYEPQRTSGSGKTSK